MANQYRSSANAFAGTADPFTARIRPDNHSLLKHASLITGKAINLLLNEAVDEYVQNHHHEWVEQTESSHQEIIDKLGGK